ncbi:MAG: capsular biosynthesis protein [Alphaproteobacteria bacterium]|nr:capsular biosynthesis protein [Alphaproteobacteria bacterium]
MSHHFVFLQGMPCSFFSQIGKDLSARGCRVTGVNLCFGDWFFWKGKNAVNYRGSVARWSQFIGAFFDKEQVTDLVLLGEQRFYHKAAIEEAKRRNIRVTVTDFGHLRPDWITLERNGMSGNSSFPKDMATIRKLAEGLPAVDSVKRYSDSFWAMAIGDLIYSFGNVLFAPFWPGYRRPDKRPNPFYYFPAMGLRIQSTEARDFQAQRKLEPILNSKEKYFVFPLQLEHDFQIVAYSSFNGMEEPIRKVIRSFAEHSEKTTRLIVKSHPLDPWITNWERCVARAALDSNLGDRVVFVDGGNLDKITAGACGMVTVNSTSGVKALQLGVPVKVLGQAVYDIEGLTYRGDLDAFWRDAKAPKAVDVDAFINVLAATIQIRGVFFSEPGRSVAVKAAADRLFEGNVGEIKRQ